MVYTTMGKTLLFLTAVGALAMPAGVRAQSSEPRDPRLVQPERPTVATHAGTVARGWAELEEGVEWDKVADGTRTLIAPTNLKIGLTSNAQVNVLFNLIYANAAPGEDFAMGDLALGVKFRIVEGHWLLGDFAILPAVKFATATASSAGTGTTDVSLLLISSRQVGRVAVDLNVGRTRRGGDGTSAPRDAGVWTASFGFPITGPLGATVEFFGYPRTSGPAGADGTAALLIGPTYLARKWLSLDAGIIVPLTGPQPHAIYTGFVWNMGCFGGKKIC